MLKTLMTMPGGGAAASVKSRTDGKEVTQRLLAVMRTSAGMHIESLLCALGTLAGYFCQAGLLAQARARALARGMPETALLSSVQTNDAKTYFFGDHVNKRLAQSRDSVWGVSGEGARQPGCRSLPDITEMFNPTTAAPGTDAFGKPRVPSQNRPQDLPINDVPDRWPVLEPRVATFFPDPKRWLILFSHSIQEAMATGRTVLDPCLALGLVMESAIPMSKVNLDVR